jgi:hypothetical protein
MHDEESTGRMGCVWRFGVGRERWVSVNGHEEKISLLIFDHDRWGVSPAAVLHSISVRSLHLPMLLLPIYLRSVFSS